MEELEDNKTLWVGGLSDKVTEEILYELFLQVGPLEKVCRPKDNNTGNLKPFAFITFKDACSVPYAMEILYGTKLYNKALNLRPRNNKSGQAVNVVNDERSYLDHRKSYGTDSANGYMSPSNYRDSRFIDEDERRNFDRHRSRTDKIHQNNILQNIPFSQGSQNFAQDFFFELGKQLLNQVPVLPNALGPALYASQRSSFNYLGGTPITQRQGGKSHEKKHSTPNNYPYPSERSRERDSNYDRDKRRHDGRRQ